QTTLATSALTASNHIITAVYGGDGNFTTSTSGNLTQTVNKASTTTGITSSVNPSVVGQSVTFTAAVSPSTASGTVTFKDGLTTLGTGTLAGGLATYSTSALATGTHAAVTAVYAGDNNFTGSTSTNLAQTVN